MKEETIRHHFTDIGKKVSHKKEKWIGEIKYHSLPERRKIKSSYEESHKREK